MALWKEPVKSPSSSLPNPPDIARFDTPDPVETPVPARVPAKAAEPAPAARSASESLIAPDLVIEGKIEGAAHVRIAGRSGKKMIENGITSPSSMAPRSTAACAPSA